MVSTYNVLLHTMLSQECFLNLTSPFLHKCSTNCRFRNAVVAMSAFIEWFPGHIEIVRNSFQKCALLLFTGDDVSCASNLADYLNDLDGSNDYIHPFMQLNFM